MEKVKALYKDHPVKAWAITGVVAVFVVTTVYRLAMGISLIG